MVQFLAGVGGMCAMEMNDKVQRALLQDFGTERGTHLYQTVWRSVLLDFLKTLQGTPVGERVTEEYMLDDHTGSLSLVGWRNPTSGGTAEVLSVALNTTVVWER